MLKNINNLSKKYGAKIAVATGAVTAAAASFAQAADPFTGAVTDVTAKVGTYGAALVGLAAVGVGFMVGIKYIKKIRGAA